jgi:NodT family efflux transporter outer membrane factor (OMF) lipoprotein
MKRGHGPIIAARIEARRASRVMALAALASRAVLSSLLLVGCTVGPDFHPPTPDTPDQFADTQRAAQARAAAHDANVAPQPESVTVPSDPDPRWWRTFNDPQLDALIERAIGGNLDLQQAVLRIVAARAQEAAVRGGEYPQLNATGSVTREELGLRGLLESRGVPNQLNQLGQPGSPLDGIAPGAGASAANAGKKLLDQLSGPVNLYQVGFDASWELDLFGKVRRGVEAAGAQTQAAVEGRNDALVSLEAEVARTYTQLRGAQMLEAIGEEDVHVAEQVLELTRNQRAAGLASDVDVNRAEAQLGQARSRLPAFQQEVIEALNGLAVLVGSAPGTLDAELAAPQPVPNVPQAVPVGLPAALARRRPDVRQAEAQLHAVTAQVGVAVAQLFPDISLTGQFGFRATEASYLTRWASHFFSVGPQVSLPIFEGGTLRAQVDVARAQQASAVLAYRQTVLSALREVDDGLARYRNDQARRDSLQQEVDANGRAFGLARNGYEHGLASFIDVLDTQRQLANSRIDLAQSTMQVTNDLVALYKSLGGGWQDTGR